MGEEKIRHWTRRAAWQATAAQVAFKNLMTHGSAIRTAYRTSLRSSSLWEPRHPPLRIWFLFRSYLDALIFSCVCGIRGHSQLKAWLSWVNFSNDPSAGSPTETLLRLLLPLSDKVYLTFRDTTRGRAQSERFTGPLEIGRSDGRCVQRAGT